MKLTFYNFISRSRRISKSFFFTSYCNLICVLQRDHEKRCDRSVWNLPISVVQKIDSKKLCQYVYDTSWLEHGNFSTGFWHCKNEATIHRRTFECEKKPGWCVSECVCLWVKPNLLHPDPRFAIDRGVFPCQKKVFSWIGQFHRDNEDASCTNCAIVFQSSQFDG